MKVFKNFLYNVFYQVLLMILPLITAPYIARTLGAEKIGIYSFTYSIAYYFVIFSQLGLSVYGNRSIASVRDSKEDLDRKFSELFKLQLITSTIFIVIYCGYVLLCNKYKIYFLIQFFYVISALFDISWFYFGIEEFKKTVTKNSLVKICSVILILILVKKPEDLFIYCLIMSCSTLLGQLSLWINLKKYVCFKKIRIKDIKEHLKPTLILFLPTIATSLYRVMDKIMLGSSVEITQLGLYENSEKFIAICMGVINALGTVMIPKISNLISKGKDNEMMEYISKSMEGIYILAFAISFGLAGISNKLSLIFYGQEFSKCGLIILLLASSILFSTWANVIRTQYLVPKEKDKEYIISMFCGAFINIVINMIFIKKLGAIGAAIGTIAAEMFVSLSHSYYVKNKLPLKKYIKTICPYFFFGLIMFAVTKYIDLTLETKLISLILEIVIGGFIYIVLIVLYTIRKKTQYYFIIKNFFDRKTKLKNI